jgi:hypothetical protein
MIRFGAAAREQSVVWLTATRFEIVSRKAATQLR